MGKRLQINNLNVTMDSSQLEALFATAGKVKKARVVVDQYNGRSRGFGYVEMSSEAEAAGCIEKFHGFEHEGRALVVIEAKDVPKAKR